MKILKSFLKYLRLSSQGKTVLDKLAILIYFPGSIIRGMIKKDTRHRLIKKVTVKSEDGIFFCSDRISGVWVGSSFHERDMRKYFHLEEGIFIDIGANIGKYSIILGRQLGNKGKVIAFEPYPKNFRILKKNIELNTLKNIIPFELALGNTKGESELYIDTKGTGTHSLLRKQDKKVSIHIDKLDNIIPALGLNRVDLIKADVEGFEPEVFEGGIKTIEKFRPRIIFEALDTNRLEKIKEILKPLKYHIKTIGETDYLAYPEG